MATVSFNRNKPQAAPATAPAAPVENLPAVVEPTNLAVETSGFDETDDSWKRAVMAKPYLAIGARTGDLTAEHPEWIGKLVYDKALGLDSVRIVCVGMRHGYEQDDPDAYNEGRQLQRWPNANAAKASGLPFYDTVLLDLLLECDPDHDLAQFSMMEVGGKCYAPALFGTKKKTMSRTTGIIVRDELGWLKGDKASGFYVMRTELDKSAKNPYYFAFVKADGAVAPELRDAIREKFGV